MGWGVWGRKGHLRGSRLGGHDKDKQVEACIVCTSSSRPQEQASTHLGMIASKSAYSAGTNTGAGRMPPAQAQFQAQTESQLHRLKQGCNQED